MADHILLEYKGVQPSAAVLDAFTRANENPLSGGGNWARAFTIPNQLKLVSNAAVAVAGTAYSYWTPASFSDCECYASGDIATGLKFGVLARITPGTSSITGYSVDWTRDTGLVELDRGDGAGGSVALGTAIVTYASGDKLGIRCIGTTIEVWTYHAGTWTRQISVTDATYASGYLAIGTSQGGGGANLGLDDFGGGALPDSFLDSENGNRLFGGNDPTVSYILTEGGSVLAGETPADRTYTQLTTELWSFTGVAPLSGAGTSTTSGFANHFAVAALTGSGTSTVSGTRTRFGSAALTGAGTFAIGAIPNSAPTTPLLDDFNRADENPLSGGGNWLKAVTGGVRNLKIVSNQVAPDNLTFSAEYWAPTGIITDSEAYLTIQTLGTAIIGACARLQDFSAGDTFDGYAALAYDGAIAVAIINNTMPVTLGEVAVTWTAGDKIGIRCVGTTIEAWAYQSGVWSKKLSVTDTTYASGYIGLYMDSDSSARADDFGGGVAPLGEIRTAPGAASLTGAGALSATGTRTRFGAAALSGSGLISVSGFATMTGAAALSGVGTATIAGVRTRFGAADLTGSGTLGADGTRTRFGAANLAGTGSVTVDGIVTSRNEAHLTGTGSLSASGTRIVSGAVALTASGSLSATGELTAVGAAALIAAGSLSGSGIRTTLGAVALSGAGSSEITGFASKTGAASLAGVGTLSADGVRTRFGASSLNGSGSLSAIASRTVLGAAALTSNSNIFADWHTTVRGAADLSGTGSMTTAGFGTMSGVAALAASSSLTVSGVRTRLGAAALLSAGSSATSGFASKTGAASLVGSGSASASGTRTIFGVVALAGAGVLVGTGSLNVIARAALTGSGMLSATGDENAIASAALTGRGSSVVSGFGTVIGEATLTGLGTIYASYDHGFAFGASALASRGSLYAKGVVYRHIVYSNEEPAAALLVRKRSTQIYRNKKASRVIRIRRDP